MQCLTSDGAEEGCTYHGMYLCSALGRHFVQDQNIVICATGGNLTRTCGGCRLRGTQSCMHQAHCMKLHGKPQLHPEHSIEHTSTARRRSIQFLCSQRSARSSQDLPSFRYNAKFLGPESMYNYWLQLPEKTLRCMHIEQAPSLIADCDAKYPSI